MMHIYYIYWTKIIMMTEEKQGEIVQKFHGKCTNMFNLYIATIILYISVGAWHG